MAFLGTINITGYGDVLQSNAAPFSLITVIQTAVDVGAQWAMVFVCRYQFWKGASPSSWNTPNGSISGTVTENSVPVPRCIVKLYFRSTGDYIEQQITSAAGTFTFTGISTAETNGFFVVALDPDGGVQYNAIIFDRLTPVV